MNKPAAIIIAGEPKPDEPDNGKIVFPAPDGFDTEGKAPGDTVQAVVDLEIEEGGNLCLKKINGIELGGYADKPKPAAKSFAEAVTGDTSDS